MAIACIESAIEACSTIQRVVYNQLQHATFRNSTAPISAFGMAPAKRAEVSTAACCGAALLASELQGILLPDSEPLLRRATRADTKRKASLPFTVPCLSASLEDDRAPLRTLENA